MDSTAIARRRSRRLIIAAVSGGIVLLLLVGVGIYGLLRGPGEQPQASPSAESTPQGTSSEGLTTIEGRPARIADTGDPELFARAVAEALFCWDTTSDAGPADYAQVLVDAGDESELDALASDVRSYLPSTQAWAQLRTYQARQWLTIDTLVVPEAWRTAVEQAAPRQLPDGAAAYTVTGTRHRSGTWGTESQDASRQVSFTVFIACPPSASEPYGGCSLVRLSALDSPLR